MQALLPRNWRVLTTSALSGRELITCSASAPSPWPGCVLPRWDEDLSFPKAWPDVLFPYLSSYEHIKGAIYPSICPLFSRISKRRRGVSFCQVLQLPGMFTSPRHLNPNADRAAAPPALTRAKLLVRSAQPPGLSTAQLSLSHRCLYSAYANILKASRTLRDALCRECNNAGP